MKRFLLGICYLLIISAFGQSSTHNDLLLQTIQSELDKNMKYLKSQRIPAHFLSYRIEETETYSITASSGVVENSHKTEERLLTIQIQVGSKRMKSAESKKDKHIAVTETNTVRVSFGNDSKLIAQMLWQETDKIYMDAMRKYKKMKANTSSASDNKYDDYLHIPKQSYEKPVSFSDLNFSIPLWEKKLKGYTQSFVEKKGGVACTAVMSFSIVRMYFISSSGKSVVQNTSNAKLTLNAENVAENGVKTTTYKSYLAVTPDELPTDNIILADLNIRTKTTASSSYTKSSSSSTSKETKKLKEQLLTQLDANITLFLSTVQIKREQALQQLEKFGIQFDKYQAKLKNKKVHETDVQVAQSLKRKMNRLEKREKIYNNMEIEARDMRTLVQNQLPANENSNATVKIHQIPTDELELSDAEKELLAERKKIQAANEEIVNTEHSKDKNTVTQAHTSQSGGQIPSVGNSENRYIAGNVAPGYYIILGSFREKSNAERYFLKVQKQYSKSVILYDNTLYLTALGPYATTEDANAQKPTDIKSWILRVGNNSSIKLTAH